jgi:serine/threonine protein kinase
MGVFCDIYILSSISHPNIIQIVDIYLESFDKCYIVFPKGINFKDYIRNERQKVH